MTLPEELIQLDAMDPRRTAFEALTRVERFEYATLVAMVRCQLEVLRLYQEYTHLHNAMTLKDLKEKGYQPWQGVGHTTLMKNYLMDMVIPNSTAPGRERDARLYRTRLSCLCV